MVFPLIACSVFAFSISFNTATPDGCELLSDVSAVNIGARIIQEENLKIPPSKARMLARTLLDASTEKIGYPMLLAVVRTESRFNTNAISPAGAMGLGQVMPRTAQYIAKKAGIVYDPDSMLHPGYNIRLSVEYLERLMERYGGDLRLVAAAYNGGPGGASLYKRWLEGRLDSERVPRETMKYVECVIAKYGEYTERLRQR